MGDPVSEAPSETVDWEAVALSIIKHLLGKRLSWPLTRVVDAYPVNRNLILTGRPVREIHAVTVTPSGRTVAPADYQLAGGFRLRISHAVPLPRPSSPGCRDREIEVEYTYGSPPPPAVKRAIDYYAEQLELGAEGSSECKLPKRITSIVRQGISMTVLDPGDFLDKGRTGLPEVDSVLAAFNRGNARARARLFTDRNPPARRLSAVTVQEEEEDEES